MITYLPNDPLPSGQYRLSYQSLRDDYLRFKAMSDADFKANILHVLHLACIICWLKESQAQWLLSDTGLIHELVHLAIGDEITTTSLSEIRILFTETCELAR